MGCVRTTSLNRLRSIRVGRIALPLLAILTLLATLVGLLAPVRAQDQYPSRALTIVVPITAGTTIDILARLYADKLSKKFGQQVVVANRPGAGGLIAAQAVASAPADGYTVLFVNSGHAILGTLNKNLPFDPVKDFAGISLVGEAPTIVTVPPSLGIASLAELVALAKTKPGALNYGSAGIGTATHLAGAYFALLTNTELVHIPYTVSATIIADLLGGRLQASFVPMAFVLPLLEDGRLRPLAVSANEPVTDPVRIPTAVSQGIDYQNATWYGLLAPAKTPRAALVVLNQAIVEAGKDPELQGKVRVQGINPRDIGLDQFDAHIRNDMARLAPLLKSIEQSR
jgi:tripartite-type tricarboxylate transporter receptor subunit TctC